MNSHALRLPRTCEGQPFIVPSLPLSPLAPDSADDSVTATYGIVQG